MKLLLKVHGERTARQRRTPERHFTPSPSRRISSANNSNNNYSSLGGSSSRSSESANKKRRLTRNTLLLGLLMLLVLAAVIVIVFVELSRERPVLRSGDRAIYFGNSLDDGTFPNIGNGHLIINREQWGASELAGKLHIPLIPPVPYVLITHVGVQSTPCNTIYKCSIKMRTIQDQDIAEKRLPDIQSNFYVSDEGHIYVGRGWDYANSYANNSLAITFMGDYTRYRTSKKQLEGVQYLLAHGVTNRILDNDYKLIAHNQTKVTKSPGSRVYCEIKHWEHFYPCGMNKTPICGSELGMTEESWMARQ